MRCPIMKIGNESEYIRLQVSEAQLEFTEEQSPSMGRFLVW